MSTYDDGKALSERLNPGMETALRDRYGHLLPDMAEGIVDWAYGRHYADGTLPLRERYIATIAALTAQGTARPQLKVNIAGARTVGLTRVEIAAVIWQMALYGGLPAAINGLNAALEVFAEEDAP
ncbi:MAG: carboxymuconolactone decarboxylase family protein [Pseudomonadota bacterium]